MSHPISWMPAAVRMPAIVRMHAFPRRSKGALQKTSMEQVADEFFLANGPGITRRSS